MVDDVYKSSGYAVSGAGNNAYKAGGYIVLGPPSSSYKNTGYIVLAPPSSSFKASGYIIIRPFFPPENTLETALPFNEVSPLADCISFGSSGGPGFKTGVYSFDSGIDATTVEWDRLRSRFTLTLDRVPPADMAILENTFYSCRGKAIGFRYKDWNDFTITNQNVFVGDGANGQFQLFKRYSSGGYIFDRIINKPKSTGFRLAVDGMELTLNTDFFVNDTTGVITMQTTPAAGSIVSVVSAEFDVPVRFDTDLLEISYDEFQQLSVGNVPLIEVAI